MAEMQDGGKHANVAGADDSSSEIVKRKVGRPIMDHGDPFSAKVTPEQRRVILRRVANRESARRVRMRRNKDLERVLQKAEHLEAKNAAMCQELKKGQTFERDLQEQLAQVQKDISIKESNNAGMRTTIAHLRQHGATVYIERQFGNMLPLPSSLALSTELPVEPELPNLLGDTFAWDGSWLGCLESIVQEERLDLDSTASPQGIC